MNDLPGRHGSIKRMIVLPFRKSLEISYKTIKVRFFRSMITVGSLVLAVAFLGFVFINLDVAEGLLRNGGEEARTMLDTAGYEVDIQTDSVAMSPKERWIVILSLLVCTVGIINAQLMSVTERFREIGIMKCLGALDKMVLRLFLLEAAMEGLAGSIIGAVVGLLFSLLAGLFRFGFQALGFLPPWETFLSFSIAVGVGLGLSLIGVLYPAYVAARMRPVMALKAEH